MSRKPRISFPGALHHVIMRGNHKEDIFLRARDRKRLIELLNEYHERYLFKCYAYALMPNHIHLLIEEENTPLSKIMQGINQSYTQYYNAKYEKVGHLFQGRYKAILCDKDRYLLILVRYIHLNPIRALIVKRPEDYKWSSHNAYCSNEKSFIETEFVLSLFAPQKKKATRRYRQFIYDGIKEGIRPNLDIGLFIGDDEFVEKFKYEPVQLKHNSKTSPTLRQIASLVADHCNVREQSLRLKGREKRLCKIRGLIGYLANKYAYTDQKEIAQYFNRSTSAMCNAIQNTIKKLQEDPAFRSLVKQLMEKLLLS